MTIRTRGGTRQNFTIRDGDDLGEGGKLEKWSLSAHVWSGGDREGTTDRPPGRASSAGARGRCANGRMDRLPRRRSGCRPLAYPPARHAPSARRRSGRHVAGGTLAIAGAHPRGEQGRGIEPAGSNGSRRRHAGSAFRRTAGGKPAVRWLARPDAHASDLAESAAFVAARVSVGAAELSEAPTTRTVSTTPGGRPPACVLGDGIDRQVANPPDRLDERLVLGSQFCP